MVTVGVAPMAAVHLAGPESLDGIGAVCVASLRVLQLSGIGNDCHVGPFWYGPWGGGITPGAVPTRLR